MNPERHLIANDISAFLKRYQEKELLRFVTVGSVDDGKSTLIGRLLYDSNQVFDDQLAAVKKSTKQEGMEIDFSLLTDGLKAEREQGITIDVAYRYFTTEKRKFIIADTPGHVEYTRNMATGASTAQVALILIDARLGILPQSKRHAYIASLLGIPNLAVCVNKMDLKDFSQKIFEEIRSAFGQFTDTLNFARVDFFPISALQGNNIVHRLFATPWYEGPTVLEYLEIVPIPQHIHHKEFSFPVQYVIRPDLDFRGYAGTIASGIVRRGDKIKILPSGRSSSIKAITTFSGELEEAFAPQAVTLCLNDEIDVSRSDMIVHEDNVFHTSRRLSAMMVWMNEKPLDPAKNYWVKQGTSLVTGKIETLVHAIDVETLTPKAAQGMGLNEIARVELVLSRPLAIDLYKNNRQLGAFILIDRLTNATVACGMIDGFGADELGDRSVLDHELTSEIRANKFHQKAASVWIEGNPGSGRMIVARALENRLFAMGHLAYCFDRERLVHPDGIISHKDIGSIRLQTELALKMGQIAIIALTIDSEKTRATLTNQFPALRVRIDTPEKICADRLQALGVNPKKVKTLKNSVADVDLIVEGTHLDIETSVSAIIAKLEQKKILV